MRRGGLALFVVLALVLGACGGGDDDDEAVGDGDGGRTTSSTVAEDDATSTSAAGGSVTTAPGDDGGDDGTSSTTGATTGTTARSSGATTAPARTGPQAARPGVYTYDVDGETRFGATRQPLPSTSRTTVDRANGSDQRSRSQTGEDSSEQILRYRPDGVHLLYLRTSQGGGQFVTEFRPNPPVLFAPADVAPGRTWSWTMKSTNGQVTVKGSFKALRNERVTIGGTAVETLVVESTVNVSGQVTATSKATSWASTQHSLIVKSQTTTDGSFNNVPVHSESTSQLRSLNPS